MDMNTQVKIFLIAAFVFVFLFFVSSFTLIPVSAQALPSSTLTLTLARTSIPTLGITTTVAPSRIVIITSSATSTPSAPPPPSATITPSLTPTLSRTATPTPIHSSGTDIAEIKDLLKKINDNTSEKPDTGFPQRWAEDTFFNVMWEAITQKLLSAILAMVVAIPLIRKTLSFSQEVLKKSGISKLFAKLRAIKSNNSTKGKPDRSSQNKQIAQKRSQSKIAVNNQAEQHPADKLKDIIRLSIDFLNIFALLLVFLILLSFVFAPKPTALTSGTSSSTSVVGNALSMTPTAIPSPTIIQSVYSPTQLPPSEKEQADTMILLILAEAMGVGVLLFFVIFTIRLAQNQTDIYDFRFPKINFRELGYLLLPSGVLILILYILPYPVDAILLPLLIQFFIFAFFDLVQLYPNLYLKNIVINHYPKIIFVAVFGVWFRFLSVLKDYASPFWKIYQDIWASIITRIVQYAILNTPLGVLTKSSRTLAEFIDRLPYFLTLISWEIVPILLAILLAIAPWRQIKKISEANHIVEIRKSIKYQNASKAKMHKKYKRRRKQ